MDKMEKIPIPEDVKKVLDNVSHILIGLNYKETARDYKQAVEKLVSLSEEPVQKFNTGKLQEIAKPATPHKKPTPEDRAKFMEELHEYAESKKPDKSLEEAALSYVKNKYNFSSELVYNNIGTDDFKAGAEWQKSQIMKDAVEGYVNYYEDSGGILMAEAQVGCPYHNGDKVRIVVLKVEEK